MLHRQNSHFIKYWEAHLYYMCFKYYCFSTPTNNNNDYLSHIFYYHTNSLQYFLHDRNSHGISDLFHTLNWCYANSINVTF